MWIQPRPLDLGFCSEGLLLRRGLRPPAAVLVHRLPAPSQEFYGFPYVLICFVHLADPSAPNVQVTRLTLMCETAPAPLTLDLQGDLESFKKQSFVLKEGVEYRIKISFKELMPSHNFCHIDKSDYMVGSYGPRPNEYEFLTPLEEAPKGMLARGTYNIKSKFTDDDKHDHLSWEWNLNIKKDWKD
uniref:Rho GDP-dissociation inhibitor 1 n=1 Tax=Sinocyclocheilus grahami TaxID=75366 RepID=A0A672PDN4_SINGR